MSLQEEEVMLPSLQVDSKLILQLWEHQYFH